MALNPDPNRLANLAVLARLTRDRDFGSLAILIRQMEKIDRQLDLLESSRVAAREAGRSISDPQEFLRFQAYADLADRRRAQLLKDRDELAFAVEAAREKTRQSFGRSCVLDDLELTARASRRRRRNSPA